jgi:hypothetical protein
MLGNALAAEVVAADGTADGRFARMVMQAALLNSLGHVGGNWAAEMAERKMEIVFRAALIRPSDGSRSLPAAVCR